MDRRHIHDPVHARGEHRIMGCDDQCPAFCELQQVFGDERSRLPVKMRCRFIDQNKLRRRICESTRNGEAHRLPARNTIATVSYRQMPACFRQCIQPGAAQRLIDHAFADTGAAKANVRLQGTGKRTASG